MQRQTFISALAFVLVAGCAFAQEPAKVIAGTPDGGTSAAQIEAHGADGGVSLFATGAPFESETFLAYFNKGVDGNYRKSASISTMMVEPDYFVTRYNSTFTQSGVQRDDLAIQVCGGHGVVMFAHYSAPGFCPGYRVFKVLGTLDVNGVNVTQTLAGLEARIAQLESRLAAVTGPQPKPGIPSTVQCPGTHAACKMLPAGTYDRAWADGIVPR